MMSLTFKTSDFSPLSCVLWVISCKKNKKWDSNKIEVMLFLSYPIYESCRKLEYRDRKQRHNTSRSIVSEHKTWMEIERSLLRKCKEISWDVQLVYRPFLLIWNITVLLAGNNVNLFYLIIVFNVKIKFFKILHNFFTYQKKILRDVWINRRFDRSEVGSDTFFRCF